MNLLFIAFFSKLLVDDRMISKLASQQNPGTIFVFFLRPETDSKYITKCVPWTLATKTHCERSILKLIFLERKQI